MWFLFFLFLLSGRKTSESDERDGIQRAKSFVTFNIISNGYVKFRIHKLKSSISLRCAVSIHSMGSKNDNIHPRGNEALHIHWQPFPHLECLFLDLIPISVFAFTVWNAPVFTDMISFRHTFFSFKFLHPKGSPANAVLCKLVLGNVNKEHKIFNENYVETSNQAGRRENCRATILILWLVRLHSFCLCSPPPRSHYFNLNNFLSSSDKTRRASWMKKWKLDYTATPGLTPRPQHSIKVFQFATNFERRRLSEWAKFSACELILHCECK